LKEQQNFAYVFSIEGDSLLTTMLGRRTSDAAIPTLDLAAPRPESKLQKTVVDAQPINPKKG